MPETLNSADSISHWLLTQRLERLNREFWQEGLDQLSPQGLATRLADNAQGSTFGATTAYWDGMIAEPPLDPHRLDQAIQNSAVMSALMSAAPWLCTGPVRTDRQLWISSADRPLAEAHFDPPRNTALTHASQAKMWVGGLYSSTHLPGLDDWYTKGGPGSAWLESADYISGIHSEVWHFTGTGTIREVSSANDWVQLLEEFPLLHQGLLYPDWVAMSQHIDGVHLGIPAVVAIEGLSLYSTIAPTAPIYWGIETTLWLNWTAKNIHQPPADNCAVCSYSG